MANQSSKKSSAARTARLFLLALLLVGLVALALFPFPNRNLTMVFSTNQGDFSFFKGSVELIDQQSATFTIESSEPLQLDSIRVYGPIRSMYLRKLVPSEIATYIVPDESSRMEWQGSDLYFYPAEGSDQVVLCENQAFCLAMEKLSASFLMERVLMMLGYLAVIGYLLVVVSVLEEKHAPHTRDNHSPLFEVRRFIRDIKRYREYMVYAAKADLRAEVADSYLNRLWWLLEPFFNMLVYVIVFGNFMGSNIENYATFVFSALLMWNFFNKILNYSVKLVRNNKDIVSKVYIPKFVLLMSNMILNLFKLFFSLIVLVAMMVIFRVSIGIHILWVIPAYLLMLLLSFGIGMIFLHFGVYVDDLSYAVGILLNMLMFLSGIFYEVMVTLPAPLNELFMCLNPVAVFVDTMRNALLYNTITNVPAILIWLVLALLLCFVGVHIVYKNENSYVKVV